jgi:hypothetical protein
VQPSTRLSCKIRFYVFVSRSTLLPVYVGSTKKTLDQRNKQRMLKGEVFGNYLIREGVDNFICVLWEERCMPEWCKERWDTENRLMDEFKTWHAFGTGGQNFARAGGISSHEKAEAFRALVSSNAKRYWSTASPERREKSRAWGKRMGSSPEIRKKINNTNTKKYDGDPFQNARKKGVTVGVLITNWMRLQSDSNKALALASRANERLVSRRPVWMDNPSELMHIAKAGRDPEFRMRVLDLYWNKGLSSGQVAKETGHSVNKIYSVIRNAVRSAAGLAASTGKPLKRTAA